MKKIKIILIALILIYILLLSGIYLSQEKLLFHPTVLPKNYNFQFTNNFVEIDIEVEEDIKLNTILFKSDSAEGVVLFLHGNGGAINGWGAGSTLFTNNGYDVLYVDYRGYGKSDGIIINEDQLIGDCQKVYDYLKSKYNESEIIIHGTSIGTGIASELSKQNNPKKLILVSPYYSLESLITEKIKVVPKFVIKYKLKTNENLTHLNIPIAIFHGDKDKLIPLQHSQKLSEENSQITLNVLKGSGHNNIPNSREYVNQIKELLSK